MQTEVVPLVALRYPDAMMQPGTLGAFCTTADQIVPVPLMGGCESCGSHHHFIRYRWTGRDWETVNYSDAGWSSKPENYTEDGI
jgi:hypothetical protein